MKSDIHSKEFRTKMLWFTTNNCLDSLCVLCCMFFFLVGNLSHLKFSALNKLMSTNAWSFYYTVIIFFWTLALFPSWYTPGVSQKVHSVYLYAAFSGEETFNFFDYCDDWWNVSSPENTASIQTFWDCLTRIIEHASNLVELTNTVKKEKAFCYPLYIHRSCLIWFPVL